MPSKIKILQDEGIGNVLIRTLAGKPNVRLASEIFEKKFEVYSDDEAMTHALMTDDVQQSFVDMENYFNQGRSWFSDKTSVTSMFDDDELIICLHGFGDIAAQKLDGQTPKKIEKSTRQAISRLSQIQMIVRNLQDVMPQIRQ